MIDTIAFAINDRRVVTFEYDGLSRTVEPHAMGRTSAGKFVLRGYQPDGETSRTLGWKLFSVEKITGLSLTNDNFPSHREGYRMGDKQIAQIIAQLEIANDA